MPAAFGRRHDSSRESASPVVRDATRDGRAWLVLLASIPFLAALYLSLPVEGTIRVMVYPVYGVIAAIAVTVSLRSRAPAMRRPWQLVAVAIALMAVGDIWYTVLALNTLEMGYPSSADILYLTAYLVLIAGANGLTRGGQRRDRGPLLDAAIVASGALAVLWVVLMEPSVRGATEPLTIGVSLAYPAMELVLLAIGLRAMLGNARPRYLQFLLSGIALYFVSSLIYSKLLLEGTYAVGEPVDAGWIVGVLLMGVAALHPSARVAAAPTVGGEARLSRTRLAMLAVAAMLVPALVVREGGGAGQPVVTGLVACWVLMFGLVFLRLATTVEELRVSLLHRRRLQDDLVHEATHDPLTRIANRALFQRRLDASLEADAVGTALIFLDLDDFKAINDTLGHVTGDAFLQTIATRIQGTLRPCHLVARLGGDEFAVLVAPGTAADGVRSIANRVLAAVRAPAEVGGRVLAAHASAGIAYGDVGATAMELMRDADIAMYHAKSKGKDQAEEYQPTMRDAIVRQFEHATASSTTLEPRTGRSPPHAAGSRRSLRRPVPGRRAWLAGQP